MGTTYMNRITDRVGRGLSPSDEGFAHRQHAMLARPAGFAQTGYWSITQTLMKLKRRFLFAALLPLIDASANATCVTGNPAEAAQRFYAEHANFSSENPKSLRGVAASRLLALLYLEYACKQGELCAIDADPWTDTQDGQITAPLTYKVLNNSASKATVQMGYVFEIGEGPLLEQRKQRALIEFERPSQGACWKVSDVIGPNKASLLQHLEHWHNKYGKQTQFVR
jgi:hypothetical protein